MSRGILWMLASVAALALAAVPVLARTITYPTTVEIRSGAIGASEVEASGLVSSPRARCRARRTVKLFALYESAAPELIATDSTSRNGAFRFGGDPPGDPTGIRAKAPRKRFGRPHHRKVCKAGSDEVIVP